MARGGSRSSSSRSSSPAPRPASTSSAPSRSYSTAPTPAPKPAPAAAPAPAPAAHHPPAPAHAPAPVAAHPPAAPHYATHPPAAAPGYAAHPQTMQQAPAPMMAPQQSSGGGLLGSLASTVMSGMAFGTGSAIANRAVDAVMGPREVKHVHENAAPAAAASSSSSKCADQLNKFNQCVKDNAGSIASCQYLADLLQQCERE